MSLENTVIAAVCFLIAAIIGFWPSRKAGYYQKASERAFQKAHHWGEREYRLDDGTRVDDLTSTHAIEYDFAKKWAEAIGQALHYGRMTGLKAGIVLIMEKESDQEKLDNILALIKSLKLPISVWTVQNLKEEPILVNK